MYRGTTPVLNFKFPFNLDTLQDIYVTFEQRNGTEFDKTLEDAQVDGDTLTLNLTQQDTLKLKHDRPLLIQIRAKTPDGVALASHIITVDVNEILKEGVI